MQKDPLSTPSDGTLIIYDPLRPRQKATHHSDISDFIYETAQSKYSQIIVSKSYLEWKSPWRNLNRVLSVIFLVAHATNLVCRISVQNKGEKITILNPNENPVSLACLLFIRRLMHRKWRIASRFICTRDSILTDPNSRAALFFFKIVRKYVNSLDTYAAETLEYSNFLMANMNSQVMHVPYPPIDVPYELKSSPEISATFCVLGAAREDKGFLQLPQLISKIEAQVHGAHFYIQSAETPWKGYLETYNYLQGKDNVKLISSYLSGEEIQEILSKSHVILLPYDLETYRYRGSAFARRGMYLGKRIIATEGTTMSKDAIRLGFNGSLKNFDKSKIADSVSRKIRNEAIQAWDKFLQ